MNLIYGPVQSLRYNSSLGVNPLGSKMVCSYKCIYCHLGLPNLTMNKIRKEYIFPTLEQIQTAFRNYISTSVKIDNIVISGNGEPTIHPQFDEIAKLIIDLRDEHLPGTKIITLTNGAHLDVKKVVSGLNLIDERVIKVDVGNDTLLTAINDPTVRVSISKLLAGIRGLKDCVVQSLFVDGHKSNILPNMIDEWIEVIGMIKPKSVQLCTMTRKGHSDSVHAVSEDFLESLAFKLKKRTGLECKVFPT